MASDQAQSTMPTSALQTSRPERPALKVFYFTLALWLAVAVISLGTTYTGTENFGWTAAAYLSMSLAGVVLCAPVYFAARVMMNGAMIARIAVVGVVAIAMAALQALVDYAVVFLALVPMTRPGAPTPPLFMAWRFNALIYIWVYAFYAAATVSHLITQRARESEKRLLMAQAAADRARLEALRLQINPHFLFNALNAAISLIGTERNGEAETVLLRLSAFFRSSLTTHSGDMVPLEVEFEDLSAYLDIESVRFGDRLLLTMESEDGAQAALVPHFLIQPLVENAIKHGVAKRSSPTQVHVSARTAGDRLLIRVANDQPDALEKVEGSTGVGLRNVTERLRILYGDHARLDISVEAGSYIATVTLPFDRHGAATA